MDKARSLADVFLDMELAQVEVERLARAVRLVGAHGMATGLDTEDSDAVEGLGSAIFDRATRLKGLLNEGLSLNRGGAHG